MQLGLSRDMRGAPRALREVLGHQRGERRANCFRIAYLRNLEQRRERRIHEVPFVTLDTSDVDLGMLRLVGKLARRSELLAQLLAGADPAELDLDVVIRIEA